MAEFRNDALARAYLREWIRRHGQSAAVRDWLAKNPPPPGWKGTPEEWAFNHMPERDIARGV